MLLLLLTACKAAGPEDSSPTDSAPDSPPGLLLLCGGGSEGDEGDPSAWSTAYAALIAGGDITGDGLVRVVVLADSEQTDWLPSYLVWLGADEAFNLTVDQHAVAEDLGSNFEHVDAVFIKGGDQGSYYDLWNNTALEEQILGVHAAGGTIGGTSAGAMSQAEYALAGGKDYISSDALSDATTPYLDDASDGGSGVHDDFLGLLPDALVDTHFSVRGRLGRLAGAMARAIDEGAPADLLGLGIDEQTCVTVDGTRAAVSGRASVVFLRSGPESPLRIPGEPLVWAGLELHRLTAGWVYDLQAQAVDLSAPPPGAEPVAWDGASQAQLGEAWEVSGARRADEERFERVAERWPDPLGTHEGAQPPLLLDAVGFMDAHDSEMRGVNDEVVYRLLYDEPGLTGFLVGADGAMRREAESPEILHLEADRQQPMSTLILDAAQVSWRSLSSEVSVQDAGEGALHPTGLVGVRLHILYTSGSDGRAWDMATRAPLLP